MRSSSLPRPKLFSRQRRWAVWPRGVLLVALGAMALFLGFDSPLRADDSRPLVREAYVPFSDLNVLLENQPQRVLLSREQYADLVKKAKKAPETHAPQSAMLEAADYAATIRDQRAEIAGTLAVEVLEDGLYALPLDLSGVGLRRASLDGQGAPIGRAADGTLRLFVQGKGRHTLALEMVAPLNTTAAQQTLTFRLPQPPAARLRLTVPGDVEIKSGAAVLSRVVDAAAGVTRFEIVRLKAADTTLVMTLNSHLARRERAVVARSVLIDEVTQAYERLHATVSFAVLRQAVDRFRLVVPEGFEVTEAASPLLSRWAIQRDGARRVLDVRLREPTVQTVVLNVSAVRASQEFRSLQEFGSLQKWTFPKFEPLDVVGQVAVVGLLVEDRLSAQSLAPQGMIPIDTAVVRAAIPAGALRRGPFSPALEPVVAYYAPQGDFSLAGTFTRPPAELSVVTNVLLTLGDRGQEIRGGFLLAPKVERLFGFDFSCPAGWHITGVTDAANKALAFDRFDEPGKPGRIRVRLPEGVVPGKECRVYFQAAATPDAWLGAWHSTRVSFPKFAVAGATRDQGALAVDVHDDMAVRAEKLQALTPLDETEKPRYGLGGVPTSLAYRYEGQDYQAVLTAERTRPRLTARTISFFRIGSDALAVHTEILYQIEEARARELALSLPADTPAGISIRPLDDTRIKQFTSETAAGRRRWNVLLEEPRRGAVRLAVDFQQPVSKGKWKDFRLPIVRAEDVAYQSGLVAVEAGAELDVQVSTKPTTRRVDIGELVDAVYQPGRRLLGVWGFAGDPPPVTVSAARQPGYGLYPAIVEKAELSTILSPDGVAQTSAVFHLCTKAVYVEVVLPQDSDLWSVLLDDKPVKPQSERGKLLVSLPAAPVNQTRNLKLVYETLILTVPLAGQVKLPAPKLLLRAEHESAAVEVPLADLVWRLYLPTGYEVIRADGTVAGQIEPPQIAALNVAKAGLAALAWGFPQIHAAREAARKSTAANNLRQMGLALHDYTSVQERPGVGVTPPEGFIKYTEGSLELSTQDGTAKTPMNRPLQRRDRVGAAKSEAKPEFYARHSMAYGRKAAETPPPASSRVPGMMPRLQAPAGRPAGGLRGDSGGGMRGGAGGMGMGGMGTRGTPGAGEPMAELNVGELPGSKPTASPPTTSPAQPIGKPASETKPKAVAYKARLEGMSSLNIDLQTPSEASGQAVTFTSLGEDPELVVTLANRPRLAALGWAIALMIVLAGVAGTNRSVGAKTRLILWVIVIGTLVPLLPYCDTLTLPANMAVYAAALLAPYYLVAGMVKWFATGLHRLRTRWWKPAATAASVLLATACYWIPGAAGEPRPQNAAGRVGNPSYPYVVEVVGPPEPVKIPKDLVILPYDPDSKTGIQGAKQVLVPYAKYVELWNLAHPDKKLDEKAPPAPYALASGQYTTTLDGDEFLSVEGQLEIDVFTDQFVAIPLGLEGGVLARAELDGKPAQISVAQAAGPPPNPAAQTGDAVGRIADPSRVGRIANPSRVGRIANPSYKTANPLPPATSPLAVIHASGKGRHKLEVTVRLRLERRGGWRAVEGLLPAAPATALTIAVPQARTEVRLSQVADRRSYETTQPGQRIETALANDGRIGIQWRPKVGEAQVDRSLTTQSEAVLDVQEDGLRVVWQVGLEFRRSQRESFRLYVPGEYMVEAVEGDNVRGWEIRREDARQVVDVSLLKAAKDSERITLRLWRAGRVGRAPLDQFDSPLVRVADAALESGRLTIRRSPLLDVQTLSRARVTRVDLTDKPAPDAAAAGTADSPLGIRPYEAYQFSSMPFTVRLAAAPVARHVTAKIETVLKVAACQRSLESRIKLEVRDRPLHRIEIFLPEDLKLDQVSAPGEHQWTVTQNVGWDSVPNEKGSGRSPNLRERGHVGNVPHAKRPLLTILLATGRLGEVPVVLRGTLGATGPVEKIAKIALPRLEVRAAERQEGDIAVQADPAFDIRAIGLEDCESVLRDQLRAWLKPGQIAATALALHCRGPAYRGHLLVTARQPDVHCDTITNVRVTDRAVEETILLDFDIQQAGARHLTFVLPAWMRESRIRVPMLRQKSVEPTGPQPGAPVRVRLQLQDEVMQKVRVLVENDRLLTHERYLAPIPVLDPGTVRRQFVALQNAGRDELIVETAAGLDPLSRQQEQWRALQAILGAGINQAYLVEAGSKMPQLAFTMRTRAALVTTGARIGLAETTLVVDTHGAYRAELTYHVHNSTKQFLEIELPEGAALWTAMVSGEPVKPIKVPSDGEERLANSPRPSVRQEGPPGSPLPSSGGGLPNSPLPSAGEGQGVRGRCVRIPLVKTAPGDLDYPVVLKYGGRLAPFAALCGVSFPLVRARDIEVELSHVRLYLPETHHFFHFGGTMRLAESEDDLVAGRLSYETKQAQRLVDTMRRADDFAKARAQNNLKQLRLFDATKSMARSSGNERVQQELAQNAAVFGDVDKELKKRERAPAQREADDNRARLNTLYENQRTSRAKNVVKGLGRNFDAPVEAKGPMGDETGSKLNPAWLGKSQLAGPTSGEQTGKEKGKKDKSNLSLRIQQRQEIATDQLGVVNPGVAAKQPAAPPQQAQAPAPAGRRAGGRSAVERYQERLERGGEQADRTAGFRSPDVFSADLNMPLGGQSFGLAVPQKGGSVPAEQPQVQQAALPAGLASLDFEVPKRGTLYLFTTPGGDVEITAQAASGKLLEKLARAMGVLLAAGLVILIGRRAGRGGFRWMVGPVASAVMIVLGAVVLMAGFVLAGVILVVLGIVLAVRRAMQKRRGRRELSGIGWSQEMKKPAQSGLPPEKS